jgi:HopA1 effector protein family
MPKRARAKQQKKEPAKQPDRRPDPQAELNAVFDKFEIRSPVAFSFDGEPESDARGFQPASGAASQSDDVLIKAIQAVLYDRCYARRSPRESAQAAAPDIEFARRLAAANAGRERWDRGWIVHQFGPNGQAFVRKGDRERVAVPGAFIFDAAPNMTPQIGSNVSVRAPSETYEAQPGYYFAFGESLDELADNLSLTRLYFHCRAEDAALLVSELTAALNRFQTPFQFKTPTAPSLYGRTDAAVLYVGGRYFPITARIVAFVREKVRLEAATPLFTKTLWPGVGAAVEPGTGESFGSHRCRVMAEGIVDAWRRGEQGAPARYAATEGRFAAAGLDLKRPWIGPGGVDPFAQPQQAKLP